ncbi:MAG: hypothetical protein ACO4CG_04090 [Prochlorothrix sp.]
MSLSSHALTSVLDALIESLQSYRTTGALSEYGQAKLGSVTDLRTIRGGLLKVIQDEDPQRVWAKLQALYRKLLSAEFLASPAGETMVQSLHQHLFPPSDAPVTAKAASAETGSSETASIEATGTGLTGTNLTDTEVTRAEPTSAETISTSGTTSTETTSTSVANDGTTTDLTTTDSADPAPIATNPNPIATTPNPIEPATEPLTQASPSIYTAPPVTEAPPTLDSPDPAPIAPPSPAIAMVLLDADHFSLDREREVYLQQKTNCQILYRVAFANWKNRGNDGDLHHRHYLLIHVPAGRDRTDGAMLTFGSSIRTHYPRVQQVFIGSNDQIFSSLATTLVQQGYEVYRITQQGDRVAVRDVVSGEEWEIPQPPVPLDVLHDRLVKLCQWLHRKTPWISLDQLAQGYERRHGCSFDRDLDDRLSALLPHQSNTEQASLLTFLEKSPQQFVLHQSPEQPDITWVSLFSPPLIPQTASGEAPSNESQTAFEQQLIPLIDTVLQKVPNKYPDGFVSLSEVTHEFRNTYQQGINTVCTELTGKRVGAFLQTATLTLLQAKKQGNRGWFVAKV